MQQTKFFLKHLLSYPLFLTIIAATTISAFTLPHLDIELTRDISKISLPVFEDFFGRTLFQGSLPGAGDIIVFSMVLTLALYLKSNFKSEHMFWWRWRPSLGFAVFSALVTAVCFVHATKWAIGRARPKEVIKHHLAYSDWFEFGPHYISEGVYRGSFPSGHTIAAFLIMILAYVLAGDSRHSRRTRLIGYAMGVVACLYSGSMAVARSMALSHWLSDGVLGMLVAWALIHICYYWILRVPEQNLGRLTATADNEDDLPRLWELRLGLFALGSSMGIMCLVLGCRALVLPHRGWFLLLAPLGAVLAIYFLRHTFRLQRRFSKQLRRQIGFGYNAQ